MNARDKANAYLMAYGEYAPALEALLRELDAAQRQGMGDEERLLCGSIDALRALVDEAAGEARWRWPTNRATPRATA